MLFSRDLSVIDVCMCMCIASCVSRRSVAEVWQPASYFCTFTGFLCCVSEIRWWNIFYSYSACHSDETGNFVWKKLRKE